VSLAESADAEAANFTYTMRAVEPVVLTAPVLNSGNIDLVDVPVAWYVDGNLVGTEKYYIAANGTTNLTYSWPAASLSNGKHEYKVVIDPDQTHPASGLLTFDGSNEHVGTLYVGDGGFGMINILLALVLVLLIVVLLLFRGRKRKK